MDFAISAFFMALAASLGHEQGVHAKGFRGESQVFRLLLLMSSIVCQLGWVGVAAYVGATHSWLAAGALVLTTVVGGGILAGAIAALLARALPGFGQLVISAVAFIAWPLCLFSAYHLLPA